MKIRKEIRQQRMLSIIATGIAVAVLGAGMEGCGSKGTPEDGETEGDGWEDEDADETEPCYPLPDDCPPLDRRCAEDGKVEQCIEDGSGWEEATEQCGAEQHCDAETAECLCDAGYIPVLGEGTCLRVGPECTEGFEPDEEGGCAPMLDDCEDDEIQVIGGGCVQVGEHGDCGTGDYGNISDEPGTVYINGAYGGGDSDGTRERPYTTIQEGLDAVPEEGVVAVAAGTYQEALVFQRTSALRGRCAELVIVDGGDVPDALWSITVDGLSGVTIDGVKVTGFGVILSEALGVSLQSCIIEEVQGNALSCKGCSGTIEHNTILNILADEDRPEGAAGHGIAAYEYSDITITGNDVGQVEGVGIGATDSVVRVEQNRVSDVGDACFWLGSQPGLAEGSIAGNMAGQCTGYGIFVGGPGPVAGNVEIRGNFIRHVLPLFYEGSWRGYGIIAGKRETITVRENIVEDTALDGIMVREALETTIVHNTVARTGLDADELFVSCGIDVNCEDGPCSVEDNSVSDSGLYGIMGMGGRLRINNNAVIDVFHTSSPGFEDGAYGISVIIADDIGIAGNHIERIGEGGTCEGGCFGIIVADSLDAVIDSNNVVSGGQVGVNVADCTGGSGVIVRGNLVEDTGPLSISIREWTRALVESNLVLSTRCVSLPDFPVPIAAGIAAENTAEGTFITGNRVVCPFGSACSCMGIEVSGGEATIDRNVARRTSLAGIMVLSNLQSLEECVTGGLATVRDNTVAGSGGVGLWIQGALSYDVECSPDVTAEGNVIAGIETIPVPTGPGGTMVDLGDCIEVLDDAYGWIRGNRFLQAGRLGILFSDAAEGVVEGNEIVGTAVAGSIDGENPELVTRGENSLLCNGLDDFQENGGWPTPEAPWVGLQ